MRAVAVIEPGRVEVVDAPMPVYGDYECLVKVRATGICSNTDLLLVHHRHPESPGHPYRFPAILGHEAVGDVVEAGKKVRNLKVGDRVVNPTSVGKLPECGYFYSYGAMVEYAVALDYRAALEDGLDIWPVKRKLPPEDYLCQAIPGDIPHVNASLILSFTENYSALRNFGVSEGMDVLLFGDGPNGAGLSLFMRDFHVNSLTVAGHHDDRLERIARVSRADRLINSRKADLAETIADQRFDIVIDAVGNLDIVRQGAKLLKPGGKVCIFGVLDKGKSTLDLYDLPNFTAVQILSYPYREHREQGRVIELMRTGYIDAREFYSHALPIEQAPEGFKMLENREAFKVVLTVD